MAEFPTDKPYIPDPAIATAFPKAPESTEIDPTVGPNLSHTRTTLNNRELQQAINDTVASLLKIHPGANNYGLQAHLRGLLQVQGGRAGVYALKIKVEIPE